MDGIHLHVCANAKKSLRLWYVGVRETHLFCYSYVVGIPRDELVDDPQLGSKRTQLVTTAAQHLAEAGMIIFDRSTGTMTTADIGRIAAKYYIRHGSIVIFNKELKPKMSEADVLGMLSMSTEVHRPLSSCLCLTRSHKFDQLQVRESEMKELEQLQEMIPCEVKVLPSPTFVFGPNRYERVALIRRRVKLTSSCKASSPSFLSKILPWCQTLHTQHRTAVE